MLFKLSTRLTKTSPRLLRKTPFLSVQQFQSTRAMAMSKFNWLHPDDALAQLPPRPPHGISSNLPSNSNPISLLSTALQNEASTDSDSEYRIRLAMENERTLKLCLHRLSADLHWCHREQIQWPDESSLGVSTINGYHHDVLVSPIVQIFNQLRAKWIKENIQTKYEVTHEGETVIWFHADDLHCWNTLVNTPIVIFAHAGWLKDADLSLHMTPILSRLLRRAWDINANAKVIITDMESLIIIHPPSSQSQSDPSEVLYEHVVAKDLSVIRIVIAAYLYKALPEDVYIDIKPRRDTFDIVIPSGVPIDPKIPMQLDEEVFATHHCHTDFDYYSLTHDSERALQFFRWKQWVKDNCSPVIVTKGDVVQGITNGFIRRNAELKPYYSVDQLPLDTMAHVRSVERFCPLKAKALFDNFMSSNDFSLELLEDLTQEENSEGCRTFKCRIASLDGQNIGDASPTLCVKFFDDRFHPMDPPDSDEGILGLGVRWWWMEYTDTETRVKSEDMTYKRLDFLQGSLIPWYYGSHSFVLPNGHEVYGILMEYVPAPSLKTGVAGTLPREQQAHLVESARHAVRALQYADLCQHDWHSGQILCNVTTSSGEPHAHCVLIDFALVTVGLDKQDSHSRDDFTDCVRALCESEVGIMDIDLVCDSFGKREPWDRYIANIKLGNEFRWLGSQDPFLSIVST